ncbi:zinc ribbon domain-containing protein [Actinokineospora auranticolor]|uniref:Putative FmdB family regulatory protein n=1 Tax=Actinokineospora auranticolor TaxID=155976 RepID=A0A2S6GYQ6_9PSEU|nr:FmdB family zinc ribbon protein [Actinokineospora auranticolor]PPK70382.1 putative FmdB family regulatory protein [Actinokineospora auranticolor]
MPTYQYACTACAHRFEAVQSFSDAALTECPECAGRLRKLYGSVGVVFKGSGFYRNDSRSNTKGTSSTTPSTSASTSSTDSSSTPASPSTSTPSTPSAPAKSDSGTTAKAS